MNVVIRNSRSNYVIGAPFLVVAGFMFWHHDTNFAGTPYFYLALGLARLAMGALPYAMIHSERLVLRPYIFPRIILLKDIVRIESDPLHYYSNRRIIVQEESGRNTQLDPPDPNKFVGLLSERLPDTVIGRSTGAEPPPNPWMRAIPARQLKCLPFGWFSYQYDWKTHTIRTSSDE